jgi:hypothetical protein
VVYFVGAGRHDLFQATGAAWYYSSGGITEWRLLQAARSETIDRLRFGDFDGDGDTDVFTAIDGEWRISRGGTERWRHLAWSRVPLEALRFGDFDGDGRTDAFKANGSTWTYSPGASSAWVDPPLAHSVYTVDKLRFGNFDDDRRTDVFGIEGGAWSVSDGGAEGWRRLNSILTKDLDSLVFADFTGNGLTDIAQSRWRSDEPTFQKRVEWRVSRDGTGGWEPLQTVPEEFPNPQLYDHWIGNFDSIPGADALRYEPVRSPDFSSAFQGAYLVRYSGARVYARHSWNGMR